MLSVDTELLTMRVEYPALGRGAGCEPSFRVAGFEPATPCSQNKCATELRYTLALSADNGNRTHIVCLEGRKFTINPYPHLEHCPGE
jgi:hypothetical protein